MSNLKKIGIVAMTAAVGITAIAAPASVEAAKAFSDVSAKNVYAKEIGAMTELGIIHGYPDGTFRPTEKITRKHAAALISRAFESLPTDSAYATKTSNDVSAKNAYKADIDKVVKAGVIVPDAKGNFRPNAPITRGEMALALAKAYQLDKAQLEGKDATFLDKAGMKYFTAANLLYKAGITTGFDDNTFKEKDGLSRAHYAVFMYRAANLAKPEPKPEPSKPPTPPATLAPEVQEIMDLYANVKVPAGKNAADLSAENRQEAKAWDKSVSTNVFIENQSSFRTEVTAKALYTKFERIGYSKEETLSMLKKALNGEVIKGKSEAGNYYYMYFTFDDSKIVVGIEDLSRK